MNSVSALPASKPALLAELRARIRGMERAEAGRGPAVVPLGLAAVDAALPGGGLPAGCLHEVAAGAEAEGMAPEDGFADAAATGFAALLAARLAGNPESMPAHRPVLWLAADTGLYPPGLVRYGLTLERLILVRPRRIADLLWALEEAARSPALAAAVGEVEAVGLTAGRRLHLAAQAGGVTLILLYRRGLRLRRHPAGASPGMGPVPSAAVTRWRVAALANPPPAGRWGTGSGLGEERWRLDLLRCRGGRPGSWPVECRGTPAALVSSEATASEMPDPSHPPIPDSAPSRLSGRVASAA